MRFFSSLAAIVALTLAPLAGALGAQETDGTVVLGEVVDQVSGEPLASVHFVITSETAEAAVDEEEVVWEGMTDSSGRFRTDRIPEGEYEVSAEALAFREFSYSVTLSGTAPTEIRIELVPAALELDPIVAVAPRSDRLERGGFYERRASGFGYSLDREEIEARNPSRVSDLFHMIPGARVVQASGAARFESEVRLRGDCVPTVVLDGSPISMPVRLDELLVVNNLEAIEVYHGAASPISVSRDTCGTILAWTREADSMDGSPWEWRRFFAAVGFLGLAIFATR